MIYSSLNTDIFFAIFMVATFFNIFEESDSVNLYTTGFCVN